MPVITYTAVDRGALVGGHTAGVSYQIETKFQAYPRRMKPRRNLDEALDGTPESYLHALLYDYSIRSDFIPLSLRPNWREFFTSVINAELFTVDFTGTIASPGTNVSVWMPDDEINEEQVGGVGVMYAFRVQNYPT